MHNLQKQSIKHKLIRISFLTTGVVMLLSRTVLVVHEYVFLRKSLVNDLAIQASIIGNNCTAALSFNDPDTAAAILFALKSATNIVHAVIYSKDNKPFTIYRRDDVSDKFFSPPYTIHNRHFQI